MGELGQAGKALPRHPEEDIEALPERQGCGGEACRAPGWQGCMDGDRGRNTLGLGH